MPSKTKRKIIPYLTTTPWIPYTSRERKRVALLRVCPSAHCRRAKACVDAHDNIYCQRSHESVDQARKGVPAPVVTRRSYSPEQIRAKVVETDLLLEEAEAKSSEMRERWKSGLFDHLYGRFKPGGVLKHPPERQYTE